MAATDLIGKLCVKTCGRESKRKCVIVEVMDDHFVLVDGNVKRRRCNLAHLEISGQVLKIAKDASTEQVKKAMKDAGIETTEPRKHDNAVSSRPVKQRKVPEAKPAVESKSTEKKEVKEKPAVKKPAGKK